MSLTSSSLVTAVFGVSLSSRYSPVALVVEDLVQLALRRNPRRAHLLVSTVLGKHVPADPRVIAGTSRLLGALAGRLLDASPEPVPMDWIRAARASLDGLDPGALLDVLPGPSNGERPVLVIGYAETATALGHLVADELGAASYLHSTRRAVSGVPVAASFEEGHSHATSHLLLPVPEARLDTAGPVILVDDEISTGRTAMATMMEIHRRAPVAHYVLATLIDLRSDQSEREMISFAERFGVRVDVVSLVRGHVTLPEELTDRVAEWISSDSADVFAGSPAVLPPSAAPTGATVGTIDFLDIEWPDDIPEGGRHGWSHDRGRAADSAVRRAAAAVRPFLGSAGSRRRILILGTEEFMYVPLRIALELSADPTLHVTFQSTTRSPVHPVNSPGYPIRRAYSFLSIDSADSMSRYVYNVCRSDQSNPDVVLLMIDAAVDRERVLSATGPVRALVGGGHSVVVGRLCRGAPAPTVVAPTTPSPTAAPRAAVSPTAEPFAAVSPADETESLTELVLPPPLVGPAFGSYRPDEVSWLLTDLSDLDLEADVADREQLIQSGQAHYAESLPREYQPDARYRRLFEDVLRSSAARLAAAVGLVTELVLAERGKRIALASLARAGTPIGIMMRRWAKFRHGIELPHYAVSIVRGRGIDRIALDFLATHHDPASVVFVDGWTGKGAIAQELSAALTTVAAQGGPHFNDDLAVLADPGHCVRTFGSRDDFLIASACLNSTVSGLVSRTVLNPKYLRCDQFHGAKFYRELASDDVSARLLDTVSAQFSAVADRVDEGLPALTSADRVPTFAGWAAIEQIRSEYGINTINFVKPGVGETTRVLLRRVPWRILLRERGNPDHDHLRLLAAERSVPIEIRPDLPYSCVGLIRPLSATDPGEG